MYTVPRFKIRMIFFFPPHSRGLMYFPAMPDFKMLLTCYLPNSKRTSISVMNMSGECPQLTDHDSPTVKWYVKVELVSM
jgi:hypothetical protein